MEEIWKLIPNSKKYYVSNTGKIMRLGRELKQSTNNTKGYCRIQISYNDQVKRESVHRLVAKCFISNPDNLPQVNHKDGNKQNNKVTNLEWCSQSDNIKHSINDSSPNFTFCSPNSNFSVLKEDQVKLIPLYLGRGETATQIAEKYNVSKSTISEIVNGRSWKHLGLIFPQTTTSRFKGIFYRKDKMKWGYSFTHNGKRIQSCKYKTEEEACEAMIDRKKNL